MIQEMYPARLLQNYSKEVFISTWPGFLIQAD